MRNAITTTVWVAIAFLTVVATPSVVWGDHGDETTGLDVPAEEAAPPAPAPTPTPSPASAAVPAEEAPKAPAPAPTPTAPTPEQVREVVREVRTITRVEQIPARWRKFFSELHRAGVLDVDASGEIRWRSELPSRYAEGAVKDLLRGYPGGEKRPHAFASRQEVAVVVAREAAERRRADEEIRGEIGSLRGDLKDRPTRREVWGMLLWTLVGAAAAAVVVGLLWWLVHHLGGRQAQTPAPIPVGAGQNGILNLGAPGAQGRRPILAP